jgi:FtsP/CotA-like multicopper oxidase with cupredoxin domain
MDRLGARERRPWRRWAQRVVWLPVASIVAITALAPLPTHAGAVDVAAAESLAPLCKNGGTNGQSQFVLTTHDGYITTPDLNSIYMWSYSNGSDAFQYPGPPLCVTQGDTVTITLQNSLPVPTSINFVGIDGVTFSGRDADGTTCACDGKPGTPYSGPATPTQADLAAGNLTQSVAPNSAGTYTFVASNAGSYMYESGTSPELQDQMGLVGLLVVRPNTALPGVCPAGDTPGPSLGTCKDANGVVYGELYSAADTGKVSTLFNPGREFMHILSELDPDIHSCF